MISPRTAQCEAFVTLYRNVTVKSNTAISLHAYTLCHKNRGHLLQSLTRVLLVTFTSLCICPVTLLHIKEYILLHQYNWHV